jgi:hypothetical protein
MMEAHQQEMSIPYGPERQAIDNQLELQSMQSEPLSVMGQSTAKVSRVGSRRGTKRKRADD